MGIAKKVGLEAEEQAWDAPEKHVCVNCVDDAYLKALIKSNVTSSRCDYCRRTARKGHIAAPVEVLMPAVVGTLNYYFAEPGEAGVPYESAEGGYLVESIDTEAALNAIALMCNPELFKDIANAISNDFWVEAAHGHWASEHEHKLLASGWDRFTFHVKHRQRYFFASTEPGNGQDIEPSQLMPALADVIVQLGLMAHLPPNRDLYRVRARSSSDNWPLDIENLGAPPSTKATAGRMNPPGISYMYLAFEPSTAIAEVVRGPPCSFAVGRFLTTRYVKLLDLSRLPELPSSFDYEQLKIREYLLFLTDFVKAISRPVEKDGSEHIEYVPSQIVCEYFASVFQQDEPLDGILYVSAMRPDWKSLVLFPRYEEEENHFPQVALQRSWTDSANNWPEFTNLIDR